MAKNDEPLEEDEGTPVPTEPSSEPVSESVPESEPESEQPQPKKRFGTGEPIYLYVKTAPGTFDNVGEFPSRVEASHVAESDWKGHQYKTLSASEAVAEQAKLQARSERVQKTVKTVAKYATKAASGLIRVAKNVGRNAESEARYHGMIHDRPRQQPMQSVNVNVNTGEKGESVNNLKRMGQQINRQYNPASAGFTGPDFNRQEQQQPREQFIVQKPSSRFSFVPPESPIRPSKHTFNPPPTPLKPFKHKLNPPPSLIKPSNLSLSPPVPSKKQYGVRQQHGGVMFQSNVQVYRIPVHRLFGQQEPVQQARPKMVSRHKNSKKFGKRRKK